MTFVTTSDVISPELLLEAIQGAFANAIVMAGTGVALFKTGMPAGRAEMGQQIKVPYFDNIGEMEDLADGQNATIRGLSMSLELATVRRSSIAVEATWWAQASASDNPYAEMGRQTLVSATRRADKALLDEAIGDTNALELDGYLAGNNASFFDWDLAVDGRDKWGDEDNDIGALVMHSKTRSRLLKMKDSTGRPLYEMGKDGKIDTYCGLPVFVTNRLAPTADVVPKYTTLMLKKGAMIFWAGDLRARMGEQVLSDSDLMALHMYWCVKAYKRHPMGTKSGIVRIFHKS